MLIIILSEFPFPFLDQTRDQKFWVMDTLELPNLAKFLSKVEWLAPLTIFATYAYKAKALLTRWRYTEKALLPVEREMEKKL